MKLSRISIYAFFYFILLGCEKEEEEPIPSGKAPISEIEFDLNYSATDLDGDGRYSQVSIEYTFALDSDRSGNYSYSFRIQQNRSGSTGGTSWVGPYETIFTLRSGETKKVVYNLATTEIEDAWETELSLDVREYTGGLSGLGILVCSTSGVWWDVIDLSDEVRQKLCEENKFWLENPQEDQSLPPPQIYSFFQDTDFDNAYQFNPITLVDYELPWQPYLWIRITRPEGLLDNVSLQVNEVSFYCQSTFANFDYEISAIALGAGNFYIETDVNGYVRPTSSNSPEFTSMKDTILNFSSAYTGWIDIPVNRKFSYWVEEIFVGVSLGNEWAGTLWVAPKIYADLQSNPSGRSGFTALSVAQGAFLSGVLNDSDWYIKAELEQVFE